MTDPPKAGSPLLTLSRVSKRYRQRLVLDQVDLSVAAGETLVLVGRSGSGKSTLLNIMGGLDRPSSGEIHLDGQPLARLTETGLSRLRRTTIGFVFQFFNLIPTLTVSENLRFPLELNGVSTAAARHRAEALLDELGLAGCEERLPDELSGGEQQRVAIGRAIIHEPRIVFADEPTGNLDLDTATQVVALLDRVCRRDDRSLIMATHAPEVIGLADRVLTIRNGLLEPATL